MFHRTMVSSLVLFLWLVLPPPVSAASLFTAPSETAVSSDPLSLSAGDLDGDGDFDLVVCHYSGPSAVTVLLNDGSGRFEPAPGSPILSIPFPNTAAIGSFNPQQDQVPDLVVVSGLGFQNSAYLFRGDGTGRFLFETSFGIGVNGSIGRQVASPDFNGEGYDDVVFGSGQVRLGSGSALVHWTDLPVLAPPFDVATGDFDGDGHPDAAFVHSPIVGRLQIFLSLRDTGTFVEAPGSPLEFGVDPESMAAADFDGDGDLDLAVTDIFLMGTHVLRNQGGGLMVPSGFVPVRVSYPRGIATADFDGDGHPDLAVGSNNSTAISLLLGDGAGGFTEIDESPRVAGIGPISIVAADLNGDGEPDLATIDAWRDAVVVFLHTPPPVLEVAIDVLPGSDDNVIRLGSQGSLPVAILSTDEFDATTVDPASVRLAGAPPRPDAQGDPACQIEDVDRDHRADLLCRIDKTAVQLHTGDTVAVLEATTFDGTTLRGQDSVRVLAGKAPRLPATTRWPGAVIPLP